MKRTGLFLVSLLLVQLLAAQSYLDYQLRLEPVWSRVADALGEPGSVESVEFSPDGRYLVSGAKYDNSVILWRTSDDQLLLAVGHGAVKIYRVSDWSLLHTLAPERTIHCPCGP